MSTNRKTNTAPATVNPSATPAADAPAVKPIDLKRQFYFGKIDYRKNGKKTNRVSVDIAYKENAKGEREFTASGGIWNSRNTGILTGGQCLNTIAEYITDPVFLEILRLWKLYHLNGMHPECVHQAADGWRERASEKLTLYTFTLTTETIREQNSIKNAVIRAAVDGEALRLSKEKRLILSLNYSYKHHTEKLPASIVKFYKLEKTDVNLAGWLSETEHPRGILCKPCPVCGYKYGTSWIYHPIPDSDEKAILKLFKIKI